MPTMSTTRQYACSAAAVDLDPNDRRPIQFLGRASRVSPELAQEVDRRLQDFAQRYPENAAANYFYALSLWERGGGEQGRDLDKIERLLRKAESLAPEWYEPHYQLGRRLRSAATLRRCDPGDESSA